MAILTESKSLHRAQYDCAKCDKSVIFRYSQVEFRVDGNAVSTSIDKVLSGGKCEEAQKAPDPNALTLADMSECPFFIDKISP